MLVQIAIILVIIWLASFFAFHIAGGLIHLLLVAALVMAIAHFVRGRSAL